MGSRFMEGSLRRVRARVGGSGAVEAGCKAIVAQRRKLSGMRWSLARAYGILTLRCLEASDGWEETCTEPGRPGAA